MRFVSDRRAIKSPGVMSCEEIRYWLKTLKEQFGWSATALANAIGFHDHSTVHGKIRGTSFLYVTEQRRASRMIPRILSGELVRDGSRARLADKAVPLRIPPQMSYDFKTGRLCWRIPRVTYTDKLPGWNRGIANGSAP